MSCGGGERGSDALLLWLLLVVMAVTASQQRDELQRRPVAGTTATSGVGRVKNEAGRGSGSSSSVLGGRDNFDVHGVNGCQTDGLVLDITNTNSVTTIGNNYLAFFSPNIRSVVPHTENVNVCLQYRDHGSHPTTCHAGSRAGRLVDRGKQRCSGEKCTGNLKDVSIYLSNKYYETLPLTESTR